MATVSFENPVLVLCALKFLFPYKETKSLELALGLRNTVPPFIKWILRAEQTLFQHTPDSYQKDDNQKKKKGEISPITTEMLTGAGWRPS